MVTRKYVRDYQISESIGKKGRIKTSSIYIGSDYYFIQKDLALKTAHILVPMLCAAWISYIIAMIPQSCASRQMYIILPFAFIALPLGYLTGAVITAMRVSEPMIHSDSDRLSQNYPTAALFGIILSCAVLLSEGITALAAFERMRGGDIIFFFGCAVIAAVMIWAFVRRGTVRTQERKK